MKKQLLLGSALLAAISAFPQNGRTLAQPKMADFASKVASKYMINHAVEASPFQAPASAGPAKINKAQARAANTSSYSTVTTWNNYTGSENIYGMLVTNSRPLQYNDELGRVSFVHRKSHTYLASPSPAPTASTGVIVADITNDWGQSFDSTALWSNDTYWARYPQGGIYNTALTNTDAAQSYVIGTGPVTTAASSWQGNWFASKRLDTVHGSHFNNVPSAAAGAQQFIANSGVGITSGVGKVDFARLDFATPDDGKVHALGMILNDANNTTSNAAYGLRGAKIVHANFNASTQTFSWTSGAQDSIIFAARVSTVTVSKMLIGEAHMAWSEDGATGYAFMIGVRVGATGNNRGYQPIIYKTTNHGATWDSIPESKHINFNNTTLMHDVLVRTPAVSATPSLTIPFFNTTENIDGIVDMNGKLHIMATILGSSKSHIDSMLYSFQFPNSVDGQTYSYGHAPGQRPYIYDFVGDGVNPWSVILVDSMSSEAPGSTSAADDGFASNPWDIDPTTSSKVGIDARMQMSRTPDGKYIVYTWAESDSLTTANSVKWNISPNIKARMLNVSTMALHPNKISITDPVNINDANPGVRGFAYNHYVSPKCALNTYNSTAGVAIFLPMTVSNNGSLHQLEPVDHYFSAAVLNFDDLPAVEPPHAPDYRGGGIVTGIATNALNSANNSVIYPNPASGSAVLVIDMKNSSNVNVSVTNIMGQQVKATDVAAQMGQNQINVDLSGLPKGIYMVNVKVGAAKSTKKLIVE